MEIRELYREVNNRFALDDRPPIEAEKFIILLSVMDHKGMVKIKGDQVEATK